MEIEYFSPHWGSESLPFDVFAKKVQSSGFNGVEMSLPFDDGIKKAILSTLKKHNLSFIAQHWETVDAEFKIHKTNYELRLRNLASAEPLFINSQTGKDYFSFEQNKELIDLAKDVEQQTGIPVFHETHRGKFSFAAHIMRQYLEKIPDLKIALDISHWCNVAESFLADQQDAVSKATQHTFHIHARVGYPEGPQVPDPRDVLWKEALNIHVNWWQQVLNSTKLKGGKKITITPEFGAPPYMILLPHTHVPITNQWDVNVFMMEYLKENL